MKSPKKQKPFPTEADLCARFLSKIEPGWTPYAETAGWDILLVRGADGFQVGVEAKLKMNLEVINQALEDHGHWSVTAPGPDCRAVLVPDTEHGFEKIAAYIGITIIRVSQDHGQSRWSTAYAPDLPKMKDTGWYDDWHQWCPAKRHKLPEYIPDVAAGVPSPIQLTPWKISAIKIAVTLEQRGYVTRDDFKEHKIDHRRWLAPNSWLRVENGRYIAGRMPDFKSQHPDVYKQITADAAKWMPSKSKLLV